MSHESCGTVFFVDVSMTFVVDGRLAFPSNIYGLILPGKSTHGDHQERVSAGLDANVCSKKYPPL